MARLFGVPVHVSPTWLLVAALITAGFAPSFARRAPSLGAWSYLVAFSFAVLLYLSVLAHELSHSLVAMRLGLPVRRITLHLLGGVSEIEREPPTPAQEFLVAFAGPLLSLALGGVGVLVAQAAPPASVTQLMAATLGGANLVVAVFNLLPGLPLDGGRVLQAGVWRVTGRRTTGVVAAARAGQLLAVLLLAVPLAGVLSTGRSLSLVGLLWSALVAWFVWTGASEALRGARLRQRLPALRARVLARPAVPVPGDLTLAEALGRTSATPRSALVVVDASGAPVALVSEAAVAALPDQRRTEVPVGALARGLDASVVLPADLAGEDLLRALSRASAGEYLLLEPDGTVVGVLSAVDVDRKLAG